MLIKAIERVNRNIREDGLIVSSSGFLVRAMLDKIDFSRPIKILEAGSGRGVFTREIVSRLAQGSVLHVSEIKAEYNCWIDPLIAAHPDKHIVLDNGCVTRLLRDNRDYDVIVSSLPLQSFTRLPDGRAFLESIIEGFRAALKDGGTYLQYQYFMGNKSDIERVFAKPMDDVSFVPFNILPAFVYRMHKPQQACSEARQAP